NRGDEHAQSVCLSTSGKSSIFLGKTVGVMASCHDRAPLDATSQVRPERRVEILAQIKLNGRCRRGHAAIGPALRRVDYSYGEGAAAAATISANASSLVPRPAMYAFHVA